MAESVQLNKTVYGKITYPNVINTQFTQLTGANPAEEVTPITIEEFFQAYNDLFFEIPIDGEFNSHLELIQRSTEYVGVNQTSSEIDALLTEINQLRLENLRLNQQLDELNS
jgi:tRNA G46 methylase TrmB